MQSSSSLGRFWNPTNRKSLALNPDFHAAAAEIIRRVRFGYAVFPEGTHDCRVVQKLCAVVAAENIFGTQTQILFRGIFRQAGVQMGMGDVVFAVCADHDLGQRIDGGSTVRVTAADHDAFYPTIHEEQTFVDAEKHFFDQFFRFFKRASALCQIGFQIRPEEIVQPSGTVAAVGVFFHDDNVLHEPRLYRFPERLSGMARNLPADAGFFRFAHVFENRNMAVVPVLHAFQHDQHAAEKFFAFPVAAMRFQTVMTAFADSFGAFAEKQVPVPRNVSGRTP